jgi:molecular chaperone GrpE
MDEQQNDAVSTNDNGDISLGGGVDIVAPPTDIDDIVLESYNDDMLGGGEETPKDQIKRLRERLHEAVSEKQQYLDGWQRTKADFANYKKREEEQKAEFIKFAREGLISDLIPVLESFHMAFANKEAWEKVDPSWRTGVEYIHTQLTQPLGSHGLTTVDPIGQAFNPNEQTSIGSIPTDDATKDHVVAEVVQLGYKLNGKLLRSPRVKIFAKQ